MLDIGRMNKRIIFYELKDSDETDEYNRTVQIPIQKKTVWASVEPLTGKEYLEAAREKNKQNYKIFTRYFPDFNVNMVIGFKGRKFTIESIINYRERNEMLQLMCVEQVGETIV